MVSPEDTAIIAIAKGVAGQCGVSRFDLKRVSWVWPDQFDACRFLGRNHNVLLLPKTLAGRLQPDEWRPLIATGIIFASSGGKLVRRERLGRMVGAALGIPLAPLSFLL